jgi:hypothetical protein
VKRAHAGAVIGIAACVLAAFSPAFSGGFLYWDDDKNFLETQGWRGLGSENLRWMATTLRGGPYQPLSWLSIGIDHALFGMDPRGYHATNVLLHAATAIAVFFLARKVLALAVPELRRPDLAAGLLRAPLRRPHRCASSPSRGSRSAGTSSRASSWRCASSPGSSSRRAAAGEGGSSPTRPRSPRSCSRSLAKASALALPAVLVLLDFWPLRRPLGRSLPEKAPFALAAVLFGIVALVGQASLPHGMRTMDELGVLNRLAQAAYAVVFYPAKTLLPARLSPLYEFPAPFEPLAPKFLVAALVAVAVTAIVVVRRRSAPAASVAWGGFLVLLAPVSGIVQTGPQLVADRYSYLPCLSFAVLGAGFLFSRASRVAAPIAALVVLALGVATWRQTRYWRDTETLFARALELDPGSPIAHDVVARMLAMRGEREAAQAHYRRAIELAPDRPIPHNNLGLLYFQEGRFDDAVLEFREALRAQDDLRARAREPRSGAREGGRRARRGGGPARGAPPGSGGSRGAHEPRPRAARAGSRGGRRRRARDRAPREPGLDRSASGARPRAREAREAVALGAVN